MILITGSMGFIGLHTARRFLDAGEQVVITQFTTRREPDFIKDEIGKRLFIERLDVTSHHDAIDVVRRHKITGIMHRSEASPGKTGPRGRACGAARARRRRLGLKASPAQSAPGLAARQPA